MSFDVILRHQRTRIRCSNPSGYIIGIARKELSTLVFELQGLVKKKKVATGYLKVSEVIYHNVF